MEKPWPRGYVKESWLRLSETFAFFHVFGDTRLFSLVCIVELGQMGSEEQTPGKNDDGAKEPTMHPLKISQGAVLPDFCPQHIFKVAHLCPRFSFSFFFFFLGARQAVFLLSRCYLVPHFFSWCRSRVPGLSSGRGFAEDLWNSVHFHPQKTTDSLEPRAPQIVVVFIFHFCAHWGKVHLQGCIHSKGLSLRTFIHFRSTASLSAIIKGTSLHSESFITLNSPPAFVEVFCL